MDDFLYIKRYRLLVNEFMNNYFTTKIAYELLKQHEPNITLQAVRDSLNRTKNNRYISLVQHWMHGSEDKKFIDKYGYCNIWYFTYDNIMEFHKYYHILVTNEEIIPIYAQILLNNKKIDFKRNFA